MELFPVFSSVRNQMGGLFDVFIWNLISIIQFGGWEDEEKKNLELFSFSYVLLGILLLKHS